MIVTVNTTCQDYERSFFTESWSMIPFRVRHHRMHVQATHLEAHDFTKVMLTVPLWRVEVG